MNLTQPINELSAQEKNLSILVAGFLLERKTRGLQVESVEFYRGNLKHFMRWANTKGINNIDKITPAVIREFLLYLEDTKHTPGGIHAFYRTLRAFLKWYEIEFERTDWLNPLRKVRAPKVPEIVLDPVSVEDIHALLAACKGDNFTADRDRAIVLMLFDCGARASELLQLNHADINTVTGDVLIRKGKGSKTRAVFIGRTARRALRAYLKLRKDNSSALFVTDEGERLSYDGLRGIMTRRATAAGIHVPTLHSFRRAFALNMLRKGVDLITLSRLMGHSGVQILARYLKQTSEDLREAHARASPADNL